MAAALIIGASRGLGHELVRQYRADGWRVVATARSQDDCAGLEAIGATAIRLDVTNADAIAALGWTLDGELFDVACLVAGVYGPRHDDFPTEADFNAVMHTNVLAAMRVLPVVAPMVAQARGKLAVISSNMASLGQRSSPAGSLYRASKAALNSVLVDTSLRWGPKGAICIALSPGWVQTDMGGAGAPLTAEQSVRGMRAVLAGLQAADNGRFIGVEGEAIPW